ncbi:hypothetical protein D9613_003527 [Agrocybe pediades]|uniref:beta-glucosidase n=1 Tax=Agrocybe pediades TaxID=84607 RepID=A0A8H4VLY5_9AGAR|nr:hypothetical protein D9613_003527 [Agrocybe pediades]
MAKRHMFRQFLTLLLCATSIFASDVNPDVLDACPGYKATNVKSGPNGISANLVLSGKACNVFGEDIAKLSLNVVYETADRIHVKISDPSASRYEVPESVLPRPDDQHPVAAQSANIQFNFTASPFGFSVYRTKTREVLFSTAGHPIIFEPQYLRLKTQLGKDANIYGLGEHSNPFRLPPDNTTLTLWSRDAYGIPSGTNLYGNHPIYFEHRVTGTHGVLFLNSNGMDIKLRTDTTVPTLEYNVIGGVLDFYFLAGSETDPTAVARQYAEIVGTPAEVPYWSFGLHQCRFGYRNFVDIANVISRYAAAEIPLETMWTDIDYMDRRRVFTVDPNYFPMERMRDIVDYLHSHNQRYVLMTDPAVAYLPAGGYAPYDHGKALDVWLKAPNGSESLGLVWPGVTVFPDWFHPDIQQYWSGEFQSFYNPQTGVDIDGAWIDMNEPSNFCIYPCADPFEQAVEMDFPPPRPNRPPDPNTPIFVNMTTLIRRNGEDDLLATPYSVQPTSRNSVALRRQDANDSLLNPPYAINNAQGALSSRTAFTNIRHANGLLEYDTHNLYGTMMSVATRNAMLARRPGKRTLVITRSTFPGAGAHVGKWLGDNFSDWEHYRNSIAGMLGFASVYQVPMVGSDICGYALNTTETLCARWAMLGAFYPFMRNHNIDNATSQEFYVWPSVTQAAKNGLDMRFRLLDYFYTAFHRAHTDGTPVLNPLFFKYPKDPNTFPIDLQFFFGDSILVSPVTEENATSVQIYLPNDIFYDFLTLSPVRGQARFINLTNVEFTQIPVHIKGGVVLPLRENSTMTTTQLRQTDFELVVAPDLDGNASGELYVDDGESITPPSSTSVSFNFKNGKLTVTGRFGFDVGVGVKRVRFLGVDKTPTKVVMDAKEIGKGDISYDGETKVLDVVVGAEKFDKAFSVEYH